MLLFMLVFLQKLRDAAISRDGNLGDILEIELRRPILAINVGLGRCMAVRKTNSTVGSFNSTVHGSALKRGFPSKCTFQPEIVLLVGETR